MIVRSSGAMSRIDFYRLARFQFCMFDECREQIVQAKGLGCRRKVLRRSILIERICSTGPLNRCNCSGRYPDTYPLLLVFCQIKIKQSIVGGIRHGNKGVFNSWVILLVKSLFISSSVYCRKMVRINQKEKPNIIRITNDGGKEYRSSAIQSL